MTSTIGNYRSNARVPKSRMEIEMDVRNALESAGVPLLALDVSLRVRAFTPAMVELFELGGDVYGRSIEAVSSYLHYDELAEDCRDVLRTLQRRERDVSNSRTGCPFRVCAMPCYTAAGEVGGVTLTFTNIGAVTRLETSLLESQERLRLLASVAPSFLFTTNPEMAWNYVNPRFYEFTGMAESSALGQGWLTAIHPNDLARTKAGWAEASASDGKFELEFRLRTAAGAWSWFLGRASVKRDRYGVTIGWYGSFANVHKRHRAEERQQLLLNELQHRVKNILAVVRSVLTRTLDTTSNLEEFGAHFNGRFSAISRTQGVLARTPDGLVDLEELVSEELYAQGVAQGQQVTIEGPSISLTDRTAQTLGLAIHELTTNALKFGALAVRGGTISVNWHVLSHREDKHLVLEWQEKGVEIIDLLPEQIGFGRELIEKGLPYELQAQTTLVFRPGGVWCRIELPLAAPATNEPFTIAAT